MCSLEQGPLDTHGFYLSEGTSYNSFLIQSEEMTILIDLSPVYLENLFVVALCQLTNDRLDAIDYLVINHAEGDHTGALVAVSNLLTNAKLVCSDKCFGVLAKQYPNMRFTVHKDAVKEHIEFAHGYSLNLLPVPMLHWPESCVTVLTFPD